MSTGHFTIVDTSNILEPENALTFHAALCRTAEPLWATQPWLILGPNGRPAATPPHQESTA